MRLTCEFSAYLSLPPGDVLGNARWRSGLPVKALGDARTEHAALSVQAAQRSCSLYSSTRSSGSQDGGPALRRHVRGGSAHLSLALSAFGRYLLSMSLLGAPVYPIGAIDGHEDEDSEENGESDGPVPETPPEAGQHRTADQDYDYGNRCPQRVTRRLHDADEVSDSSLKLGANGHLRILVP